MAWSRRHGLAAAARQPGLSPCIPAAALVEQLETVIGKLASDAEPPLGQTGADAPGPVRPQTDSDPAWQGASSLGRRGPPERTAVAVPDAPRPGHWRRPTAQEGRTHPSAGPGRARSRAGLGGHDAAGCAHVSEVEAGDEVDGAERLRLGRLAVGPGHSGGLEGRVDADLGVGWWCRRVGCVCWGGVQSRRSQYSDVPAAGCFGGRHGWGAGGDSRGRRERLGGPTRRGAGKRDCEKGGLHTRARARAGTRTRTHLRARARAQGGPPPVAAPGREGDSRARAHTGIPAAAAGRVR